MFPAHHSGTRLRLIIAALILSTLAACEASNPLRTPDATYPPLWPPIAHLGPGCSSINGTYANTGVFVSTDKNGAAIETPRQLSGLLVSNTQSDADRVHFTLIPRDTDKNGDTTASLRIQLQDPNTSASQGACHAAFCIDGDLACPNVQSFGGGVPYILVHGGQRNLWLTTADDGSLIIRVGEYDVGMVVIVPYYATREGWAKFQRVGP